MEKTVALIVHPTIEDPAPLMARDAVAFAVSLLLNNHRLLLHVAPSLAVPLLLAAEVARSPLVVESAERRHHPIVMMPVARPHEGPESALFAEFIASPGDEAHPLTLFNQMEALGLVDGTWLRETDVPLGVILAQEAPSAFIAMGWSPEMGHMVQAAETYAEAHRAVLLLAGDAAESMQERRRWRDLRRIIDLPLPGDEGEEPLSEEFRTARQEARRQAYMLLLAEYFAGHGSDRREEPR